MLNTDSAIYDEARNWIHTLDVGNMWNVQLLQQKYRIDRGTGERRALPFRIRRYAEGCPPSCMKKALDVLLAAAPYTGIVFRGEQLEGVYRPTKTEWSYDSRDATNPAAGRNDGTFTLVQDLIDDRFPDTDDSVSGGSCSEEVVSEWHWDEASVADIPRPVPPGWSYSIQAVNRSEDGTVSYVLVKRHALTQHVDEVVVKDTPFSHETVETWNNLYADGTGGWADHDGNPVDIPHYESGDGYETKVTPRINQDCTYDIVVERTRSKPAIVDITTHHTQFLGDHTVRRVGSEAPLGPAPDSGGGVIKTHKDTLQPDGRFTTEESTRRERPVSQAVVDYAVGRRGRRVTIEHRYQSAPALPPAATDVGHRTRSEKTDGKLYNVTEVTWDTTRKTPVEHRCEVDQYKHVDSDTTAGESSVDRDAHALSQGGRGGHVYTVSFAMDDEGAITKTVNDHLERPVSSSRESWAVTRTGTRHTVVDTQVPNPAAAPAGSPGTLGVRVTVEKTPGGLYNNTVEETVLDPGMDGAANGDSCSKTVYIHRHETSSVDSGSVDEPEHVVDAGSGHYQTRKASLTDDGARTVDTADVYELPKDSASVGYRTTVKAVVVTRTDRNVQDPDRTAHVLALPGEARHTVNDGGSWDYTETTATAVTGNHDRFECDRNVFEHADSVQSVALSATADETDAAEPGNGSYFRKSSQVDDTGVRTNTVTEVRELHRSDYGRRVVVTPRYSVVTVTEKNRQTRASDPTSSGRSVQNTLNKGGTYDVTTTSAQVRDGRDRASGEKTIFSTQSVEQTDVRVADTVGNPLGSIEPVALHDGVYMQRQEAVDENGILTATVTTVHELPLPLSKVRRTSNHFLTTYTKVDANSGTETPPQASLEPLGADTYNGTTSEDYSVNNGGSVTVSRTVDVPEAREWDDPSILSGFRAYHRRHYFRNLTETAMRESWDAFTSLVDGDLSEWNAAGRGPTSFDLKPSVTLNEFGLMDGSFTATGSWSPDAAAPGEPDDAVYTDKIFHMYSVQQHPFEENVGTESNPEYVSRVSVAITHEKFRMLIGRGIASWDSLCAANTDILQGTTFRFTPSTHQYSAHIVLDLDSVKVDTYDADSPIRWRPHR